MGQCLSTVLADGGAERYKLQVGGRRGLQASFPSFPLPGGA